MRALERGRARRRGRAGDRGKPPGCGSRRARRGRGRDRVASGGWTHVADVREGRLRGGAERGSLGADVDPRALGVAVEHLAGDAVADLVRELVVHEELLELLVQRAVRVRGLRGHLGDGARLHGARRRLRGELAGFAALREHRGAPGDLRRGAGGGVDRDGRHDSVGHCAREVWRRRRASGGLRRGRARRAVEVAGGGDHVDAISRCATRAKPQESDRRPTRLFART